MRLVFLDCETGGLDPARHCITQIACIAVDPELNEIAEFEAKLKFPPERADPEALALTSYDPEVWAKEARGGGEVADDLAHFFKRFADVEMMSKGGKPYHVAQLVGHNALTFDGPFLQALYKIYGMFLPASYGVLDTCQRAKWYFRENPSIKPPENFKLPTLAAYYGVELENAHDALADCRATLGIYRALVAREVAAA